MFLLRRPIHVENPLFPLNPGTVYTYRHEAPASVETNTVEEPQAAPDFWGELRTKELALGPVPHS